MFSFPMNLHSYTAVTLKHDPLVSVYCSGSSLGRYRDWDVQSFLQHFTLRSHCFYFCLSHPFLSFPSSSSSSSSSSYLSISFRSSHPLSCLHQSKHSGSRLRIHNYDLRLVLLACFPVLLRRSSVCILWPPCLLQRFLLYSFLRTKIT